MRKKMFSLKNIVMIFMALALLTSVGCRKQDDGGKVTPQQVEDVKADLQKKLAALEKDLNTAKDDLKSLKATKGVSAEDLNKAKDEVVALTVQKAAFEAYESKNDAKVAALETALNDLKKEFKGLDEQIKAFQAKIDANKTELEKMLKGRYTNEQIDEKLQAMGLAAAKPVLASLVLKPNSVNDSEFPLIDFYRLQANPTASCEFTEAVAEVEYYVNPSSVTEENIDKDNITVRYNDPEKKTAREHKTPTTSVKFISLKDGILKVAVSIEIGETWKGASSIQYLDRLALLVPVKGKDGVVVTSDWAGIASDQSTTVLAKAPKTGKLVTDDNLLESDLNTLKGNAFDDKKDLVLDVNETIDLNEKVKAALEGSKEIFDVKSYKDLKFEYALTDGTNPIDYKNDHNGINVDNQLHAKVEGSVFSIKDLSVEGDKRAAIGATPIVHVMLKKGDDCLFNEAYLKVKVVDNNLPDVPQVVLDKGDFVVPCSAATSSVDDKNFEELAADMKANFYDKVNMPKETFHANYVFTQSTEAEEVGTIEEQADRTLVYKLTSGELNANIGKTVSRTGKYTYGDHEIEVKFTVNLKAEAKTLDLLTSLNKSENSLYWNPDHSYVIHNVATPMSANDENPAHATFETNINNAFKVVSDTDKQLKIDLSGYTYEYKFVENEQPESLVTGHPDGDITISVVDDGKTLQATQGSKIEKIAVINSDDVTNKGDVLEYKDNSDLGKWLLNRAPESMEARLELVVTNSCGHKVDLTVVGLKDKNKFNVHFLRPINTEAATDKYFVDGVNDGQNGSFLNIKGLIKLADWRNKIKTTEKYDFAKMPNLFKFYDVKDVTGISVDVDAIKLKGSDESLDHYNIKVAFESAPRYNTTNYPYGVLTYRNNGNVLNTPITITVPITVTYKWGEIRTMVDIDIKPTSETARKAAK